MRSSRLVAVVGLGFVLLACSSTTVGTGGTGGDDDDDTTDAGLDATAGSITDASTDASVADAAGDDGDATDSDGSSCEPVQPPTVPPATYPYHPPLVAQRTCTADQVDAFITACGEAMPSHVACEAFRAGNADCDACLETSADKQYWGVLITDPVTTLQSLNEGGCIATLDTSATALNCATQGGSIAQCEAAACDTGCASASSVELSGCDDQAASGACAGYIKATNDCLKTLDADTVSSCDGDSFDEATRAIATVLCVGQ